MRIVLSGGTGFIGSALVEKLTAEGHHLVLLTRRPQAVKDRYRNTPLVEPCEWDAKSLGKWCQVLEGADALINLAGESVARYWTAEVKKRIVSSRTESTRILVKALGQSQKRPAFFMNASAIGYYGNVAEGELTETHPAGKGFLAETCALWEKEALAASQYPIRTVILRLGIVLEKTGGALARMLPPFFLFMGGPLGSGKQWLSWIHRDDVIGSILFCLKNPDISGAVNATAPHPTTMKDFVRILGKVLHRPSWFPVPAILLKLLLGEMANEMLLSGQRVIPTKLIRSGYVFRYPELEGALRAILKK